jgi:hypothetical protein
VAKGKWSRCKTLTRIIALDAIPRRIAEQAIKLRLDDKAYNEILAFVVYDEERFHLISRKQGREMVEKLLRPGIRPLVPAV